MYILKRILKFTGKFISNMSVFQALSSVLMIQRFMTVIVFKKPIAFKERKIGNIISNYTENVLIHVFPVFTGT